MLRTLIEKLYIRFGRKKESISIFTIEEQKNLMKQIAKDYPRFVEYLDFLLEQDKETYFIAITERSRNIAKGQFRRAVKLYQLCNSEKPKLTINRYAR